MKRTASDFALQGGEREFAADLHVGQLYFPPWDRYEAALRGIIERQYYTNHGPLVTELEVRLEEYFGVRNVITVTNATLGLYLVALGLDLSAKLLMPAFTFIATAQAALLAGLDPVFCDIDPATHHMTPESAEVALEEGVSGVCAVNLWGGSSDVAGLQAWAGAHELPLFFDSAQAFGVEAPNGKLGRFGAAEVFSFHATKVVSATEGGCICTDDDELAERLRNMRSNYGIRRTLPIALTVNARMSEAQAAIALLSLEHVDAHIEHNQAVFEAYEAELAEIEGIALVAPDGAAKSNYQSVVVQVNEARYGLSRDELWSVLRAEGVRARRYFSPGVHRSAPFDERYPQYVHALPVTDALCASLLQLPCGALVTLDAASRVARLVNAAHHCAGALRSDAG